MFYNVCFFFYQVNTQTCHNDASLESASAYRLSETLPFQRKEEHVDTTRHLSSNRCISNSDSGSRECTDLHRIHCSEDLKGLKKLENHKTAEELSDSVTMLSSTVATVLAPHWSGRRRTKRSEEANTSEAQGNLQSVANTTHNRAQQPTHHLADGVFTAPRVPLLGSRSETMGWSSNSGPASLNYECKRKMIQTVSLDVNSGRQDKYAGPLNPIKTSASPLPSLCLNPSEQRTPQTVHQGGASTSSSKPTTSSLLLSLRRSSGHSSTTASNLSNPSSLSSLSGDQDGPLSTTPFSQTFPNKNEQAKVKPVLSPSSISCRMSETGQVHSPLSSSRRERNISENVLFSSLPMNKNTEDKQSQTISGTKSSLPCSSQSQDTNKNLLSEKSVCATRSTKEPLLSRRTILTSRSWWKQDAQEGSSLLTTSDQQNAPMAQPCADYSNMASALANDNKGFSSSSFSSRDNNNTSESVCKSNTTLAMKIHGGLHNVTQRNTEDLPDHRSDQLLKQPYGSNLNNRESQERLFLSSTLSSSEMSSATAQTTPRRSMDLDKRDESKSCISGNVPTLNPMSSASPMERSSVSHFNHCSPRSHSIPTCPHQIESVRQPLSDATTTTSSINTSALPPDAKSSPIFHSHTVLAQTNKHTLLQTGSSFQSPSRTNPTPLGFERSYASFPKPFRPKTVSSLIPSASGFKTNTPVSTASISSSASSVPSLYLTSPPVTSAIKSTASTVTTSSLLTPPATPVSHNYSDISSPKLSTSPERDPKKLSVEGKRVRRVTWEDTVDLQNSGSISLETPDPSQGPSIPLSPSRSPRSVSTPSIFSFLRANSPNKTTSPLSSPAPKASSIQVGNGGKFRSLSSDSADLKCRELERTRHRPSDTMVFSHERRDLTTHRQERTRSMETDTVQCQTSALSLPPDFSSGYKLRYSSPPYTSLMSSRSIHGETRPRTLRPGLFQEASRSIYPPHSNTDPTEVKASSTPKVPMWPVSPTQHLELSQADEANSNHRRNSSHQNVQLVNRVHITSHSLESDNARDSTLVTETLVYSIKPKVGAPAPVYTSPTPLQPTLNTKASVETKLRQQPHSEQRTEEADNPHSHSDQSSSGSSSAESQHFEDEGWGKKVKASVLGKSRFFSMESPSEESAKKSRFALKKSISSPNSSLSRSDSERTNKSNNKMDQVINKLRQTFSNKKSDEDVSFPWKWKRASHTPSLSGSSDTTTGSTKTLEEHESRGSEETGRWTHNKYTIMQPSTDRRPVARDHSSDQDGLSAFAELNSDSKPQVHVTAHSPSVHPFDYYSNSGTDYNPTKQFLYCRDPSPGRSVNPTGCYPTQSKKSTPSPRSPFSPFSSLSPLSPFSSPDVTDDSVFYSPKLQRRRDSSSPCEPREGISLGGSRRSRASTGPPSPSHLHGTQPFTSYADLKYGIEPGRSFSVSSVLSSRASKPGRISTGCRFMSVGDLSESVLTCAGTSKDMDQRTLAPCWTTGQEPARNSYYPSDPGKMRSRSLPRSLTLANWSSGVSICHPGTSSRPACHWSPGLNSCHFAWDAEAPPTPPPTPPLSPVSRRMSKASSQPSPTFPSSPGSPQTVDSQSSRGHLPSRGYVSSLSTFEESSDSSSDTTTDDEYYLETGGEEKETEL